MANIVGSWVITTDWGCDGSITGTFTQVFNANGTWSVASPAHTGRWFQVEGLVVWTFNDTPNLAYAVHLSGSWIAGSQGYETAGGQIGCCGGHRAGVAGLAAAQETKASQGHDPVLGK